MINILIINVFGNCVLRENTKILPRVGDKVDLFYKPRPSVTSVILYPNDKTIEDLTHGKVKNIEIDAVILVE